MYGVIEFDKKECSVVPVSWLVNEQSGCLWPNVGKQEIFEDYVLNKKTPTSVWKTYRIKKLHFMSANYEAACEFMNRLIEDSSSSEAGIAESFVRKDVLCESAEMNYQQVECKKRLKHTRNSQLAEKSQSKKQRIEESEDEFSSISDSVASEADDIPQANSSFNTTVTYASTSASNMPSMHTPAVSSYASHTTTPTRNLDTDFTHLVIQRLEKVIAVQDQHSIVLDNILRAQQLQSNHVERPDDFPKFPISNKTEYRAVEEFLSSEDKFSYMIKRLSTIGGSSVRNCTMNMMKFLMSNQIGMKFNWSGKDKKAFKNTKMCSAVIEAIKRAYGGTPDYRGEMTEKVIKESIQDWLKLSKARYTYSLSKKEK